MARDLTPEKESDSTKSWGPFSSSPASYDLVRAPALGDAVRTAMAATSDSIMA